MSELSDREQELVALGAAMGSNCLPCFEYHIPEARRAGLHDVQIREAIGIADKVRRVPARTVLKAALARIEVDREKPVESAGTRCGCGDSSRGSESGHVGSS